MAIINKLSAIGAAIRAKTGKTELLTLDSMPTEIASIVTGGGSLSTGSVTRKTETSFDVSNFITDANSFILCFTYNNNSNPNIYGRGMYIPGLTKNTLYFNNSTCSNTGIKRFTGSPVDSSMFYDASGDAQSLTCTFENGIITFSRTVGTSAKIIYVS